MSYDDPRLVAIYDIDNPDGPDHDFFRAQAGELKVRTIVDLGCGTEILTVTLAAPGRRILGIDPSESMLNFARQRPGSDRVEWVRGTSSRIEPDSADLVIMSGNVAMHILGDDWHRTLADISAGLTCGGRLLFESRNPLREAWKEWNDMPSERDTPAGRLRESLVTEPPGADGIVVMHVRNEFLESGAVLQCDQKLQFRSAEQIRADLENVGRRVANVWRDWGRNPFEGTPAEPLMVFEVARADDV